MVKLSEYTLLAWLPAVQNIAREAGDIIMNYYNGGGADVTIKDDGSPVTKADHASQKCITARLQSLTPGIAIISEENEEQPDVSNGKAFWTVDPLDGTKGFINRTDRFFVKIALIEDFKPVLGVIYEPATGISYYSWEGGPALRQQQDGTVEVISAKPAPESGALRTIYNRLHHEPAAYEEARGSLHQRGIDIESHEAARGSCSTAFHMAVATGEADIYVDCGQAQGLKAGNGFSWDYAPDWLILKNAGGVMVGILSGREPVFTNPASRMDAMIGLGDIKLGKKAFPELKNDCV